MATRIVTTYFQCRAVFEEKHFAFDYFVPKWQNYKSNLNPNCIPLYSEHRAQVLSARLPMSVVGSVTLTAIKLRPLSVASALAMSVLEHPGGPYMRMPRGGVMPMRLKASGCLMGHSTACFNLSLTDSIPPMSDQRTCRWMKIEKWRVLYPFLDYCFWL